MILQHFNLLPSSINHSVRVLYIKFLGNIFSKEFWYYQGKTSILFLRPSEVPVAEQPCLFKYYSGLLIFHSATSAYPLFDKGERILWMSQPLLTLPALLYWSATNNAGKDECHAIGSENNDGDHGWPKVCWLRRGLLIGNKGSVVKQKPSKLCAASAIWARLACSLGSSLHFCCGKAVLLWRIISRSEYHLLFHHPWNMTPPGNDVFLKGDFHIGFLFTFHWFHFTPFSRFWQFGRMCVCGQVAGRVWGQLKKSG